MIVLGFDQATMNTGFSVIDNGKLKSHGVLSADGSSIELITNMFSLMRDKIDNINPDLVILEDAYYKNNAAVLKSLSLLKGMIWGYCVVNDINVTQYTPTSWRSKAGIKEGKSIKRSELKRSAVDFVKKNFNIECSDDEAEAIVISYIGYKEVNK